MIRTIVLALVVVSLAPITRVKGQALDWGQDIRWGVSLEKAKASKNQNAREIVVRVDLRKAPFHKIERVVTKVAFIDANGKTIEEKEFSLGDGSLQLGKLHIKTFPNPHSDATTVKGIELRAIVDGATFVHQPPKDTGKVIALRQ